LNRVGGNVRKADEEGRGSFLKKRTKKLLVLRAVASALPQPAGPEVFCFFFFKKRSAYIEKAGV
jgi:hypothetical protein